MAEINPAEVSSILREQLAGVKSAAELEEVGTVLQVGDGIARIYGLTNVESGELIEFENGAARYRMGSHSLRGAGILVEGLVSDPVRIWTKGFKSKHWN